MTQLFLTKQLYSPFNKDMLKYTQRTVSLLIHLLESRKSRHNEGLAEVTATCHGVSIGMAAIVQLIHMQVYSVRIRS